MSSPKAMLVSIALIVLSDAAGAESLAIVDRIWRSIVDVAAEPNPEALPTLARRTEGVYLASGFEVRSTNWEKKGRRLQVWYANFHTDGEALSELQRHRLLELADDPTENTLTRTRGAFGTRLVGDYVARLEKSEWRAYQLGALDGVELIRGGEPPSDACPRSGLVDEVASIATEVVERELYARRTRGNSYVVPTVSATQTYFEPVLSALRDALKAKQGEDVDDAISLAVDRVDVVEDRLIVGVGNVCGIAFNVSIFLTIGNPVPVLLAPGEDIPDEMVELNRALLGDVSTQKKGR